MTEIVKLQNISVLRNGNIIIKDVSWNVKAGENWVLLGPNGVGKSTLINIISARMFPTLGEVSIFGKKFGEVDLFTLRPRIGVLGSDISSTFSPQEEVQNIVALGATGATSSWGDNRDSEILSTRNLEHAQELLELFHIPHLANRWWGVLSQGERKRVQMARTLFSDPDLLLFDEPISGLDLAGREQVINTLNKIAAHGRKRDNQRAVILVNHNVEEIPPSFDKIAIMGKVNTGTNTYGTILYQGSIKSNLISAHLTNAYGISLTVKRQANLRYFASAEVIIKNEEG